jgi:hypothetical protein
LPETINPWLCLITFVLIGNDICVKCLVLSRTGTCLQTFYFASSSLCLCPAPLCFNNRSAHTGAGNLLRRKHKPAFKLWSVLGLTHNQRAPHSNSGYCSAHLIWKRSNGWQDPLLVRTRCTHILLVRI